MKLIETIYIASNNCTAIILRNRLQNHLIPASSSVERAPVEIITQIFNLFLENASPDIVSALCFGLTCRRNWTILRNLDHSGYLKKHLDQIPSIIDFKYDKIPLFNPRFDEISNTYEFHPHHIPNWSDVEEFASKDQHKQLLLLKEWMGPKYRPPGFLNIPVYLSRAAYGEVSKAESSLMFRWTQYTKFRREGEWAVPSPFGLGDAWYDIQYKFWYRRDDIFDSMRMTIPRLRVKWDQEVKHEFALLESGKGNNSSL